MVPTVFRLIWLPKQSWIFDIEALSSPRQFQEKKETARQNHLPQTKSEIVVVHHDSSILKQRHSKSHAIFRLQLVVVLLLVPPYDFPPACWGLHEPPLKRAQIGQHHRCHIRHTLIYDPAHCTTQLSDTNCTSGAYMHGNYACPTTSINQWVANYGKLMNRIRQLKWGCHISEECGLEQAALCLLASRKAKGVLWLYGLLL